MGQNVAEERAAACDFMGELLDALLTKVGRAWRVWTACVDVCRAPWV